jgi:hypothetical protein
MRLLLGCCMLLGSFSLFSQQKESQIDLTRIPQKKVRALIGAYTEGNSLPFNRLEPTYRKGQNLKGYHFLESDYWVKENPATVWKTYQVTSPAQSWNGHMVSFGMLVSKRQNRIQYRNDPYFSGIDTGQVFFVNLKIMKGLYNLAVGLQIVEIDTLNHTIRFSYLKGGKSMGQQQISFVPTRKGYTHIVHRTVFKSDSYVRDRYLYPYFHRIAINEFHRNMRKVLANHPLEYQALVPASPPVLP